MPIGDPVEPVREGMGGDYYYGDGIYYCKECGAHYDRYEDVKFCVRLHRIEDALVKREGD